LKVELIGPQTLKKSDKKSLVKLKKNDWTEEGMKNYQENCRERTCTQIKMEDLWNEIKKR